MKKGTEGGYLSVIGLYLIILLILISFLLFIMYTIEVGYIRDEVSDVVAKVIYKKTMINFDDGTTKKIEDIDVTQALKNESPAVIRNVEKEIEEAIKARFINLGYDKEVNGKKITPKLGIVRLISAPYYKKGNVSDTGEEDYENSIKVKIIYYDDDLKSDGNNGSGMTVLKQKKLLIITKLKILYPKILLLTPVKGDKIRVGGTEKSRIEITVSDIQTIY